MRITFLVSVSYKFFYKKYKNHYTCYKIPIGKSIKYLCYSGILSGEQK